MGVGRIAGPKSEKGRQPLYRWVSSSLPDVKRTGQLIGPWLSSEKRAQFSRAAGLVFDLAPIDSYPWAAGLFDAEGSVSLSDHRSHAGYKAIEGAITQGGHGAQPEELIRIARLFPFGSVNGPYMQNGANELVYRWRVHTVDNVRATLHLVDPWLGPVKRLQALRAIRVIDG